MNYWQISFTLGWTYTNTAPNSTQNLLGEKQEIGRLKSHLQSSPNRDQLIEIALWSQICVSLTRCIFDRVTTDMRHINSFTHETLWVVTHTACIVTFVSLVTNYLPKQIFLIIFFFFFIARQCIRLKLRVARLIEEYIASFCIASRYRVCVDCSWHGLMFCGVEEMGTSATSETGRIF